MVRTRVGYTGGSSQDPTYRKLGDHSEAVQVEFDPSLISYSELLEVYWDSHNPTSQSWSRQYRKAVFFHNEDQKRAFLQSREQVEAELKDSVVTELEPFTGFYLAEDYHQKHMLRGNYVLFMEFEAIYPDFSAIISSTAAARVNGYLGGNGNCMDLKSDIDGLGLTDSGMDILLREVCYGESRATCSTERCS